MRKTLKKAMTILMAGAFACGAFSLAACGKKFTPLQDAPAATAEQKSNGGFVVEKGDYVYFINGVETYTSDNTYGTPVKGALMRAKKSGIEQKNVESEMVVPSLMVASDYTSGIYIFGDRVYYATPVTGKDIDGVVQNSFLDFKSAKLDGSDVQTYFYVSSNSTVYRYVEVEGTVYLLYVENSNLHSYNTATDTDTELARSMGAYLLNSSDKTDPYVYYTMSVTAEIDAEDGGSVARDYNQIYRVRADATQAPYTYVYDKDYLEEHDNEEPYRNFGELILDGIGSVYQDNPTQFSHAVDKSTGKLKSVPESANGFTYTLQSYTNGGIYFTRSDLATTSTVGEDGWLYFLSEDKLNFLSDDELDAKWNTVTLNKKESLDIIAQSTTNAGTAAMFYREGDAHRYLYVSNGNIIRAEVGENGVANEVAIARGVGSATLVALDSSSDETYKYVYYTASGSIYRAVYNGEPSDYNLLGYEANKPFRPVQILEISHAQSWYNFEIIDGILYYADAETIGSNSYTYISAVDLNENGKLMDNAQLADFNDEYEKAIGEDSDYQKLTDDGKTKIATAVRYYFYTGETDLFYENIAEAEEKTGKEETLYTKDEVEEFEEIVAKEGKLRSDFITKLGQMRESDEESIQTYWKNQLQHYTEPTSTDQGGLEPWQAALIGVACGIVVIGAGIALYFVLRTRKQNGEAPKEEKMFVDTSDDKDVDVYATDEAPAEPEEAPAEEAPTEEAPAEEEPVEETPAEEAPAEPAPEAEKTDAPSSEE